MKLTVNEFSELLELSKQQVLKQQLKKDSEIARLKRELKRCYDIIDGLTTNKITHCEICSYHNVDKCMRAKCEFKWNYEDEIKALIG